MNYLIEKYSLSCPFRRASRLDSRLRGNDNRNRNMLHYLWRSICKQGSTTEEEDEISNRVANDYAPRDRHDHVPDSLREIQNGGIIGGPHCEYPPFRGRKRGRGKGDVVENMHFLKDPFVEKMLCIDNSEFRDRNEGDNFPLRPLIPLSGKAQRAFYFQALLGFVPSS